VDHDIPKLDPAFTHELTRILSERTAHCPRCRYDLSGVPGPRCPECGKNIREYLRIADTTPWRLPEMRRRALMSLLVRRAAVCILILLALASVGWAISVLLEEPSRPGINAI